MRVHVKVSLLLLLVWAIALPMMASAQQEMPTAAGITSTPADDSTAPAAGDLPGAGQAGALKLPIPFSRDSVSGRSLTSNKAPALLDGVQSAPAQNAADKKAGKHFSKGLSNPSEGGPKYRTDRILVKPKKGLKASDLAGLHASLNSRVKKEYPDIGGLQVIELPKGAKVHDYIDKYRKSNKVEYAEPDYIRHAYATCSNPVVPNDPMFAELWGMQNTGQTLSFGASGIPGVDMGAACAWGIRHDATLPDGSDVIVAVIDTGVFYDHPDLAANMWTNAGEIAGNGIDDDGNDYIDDVYGINATYPTTDPLAGDPWDDNGHGTHVSGTIGAVGNNGEGVAGVAWKVKIMALKFLSWDGSGSDLTAIDCIRYAWQHGAKVISASWGGTDYSSPLRDAIAVARDNGVIFVAAAGNDGMDNDLRPQYPACYDVDENGNLLDNLISVAATDFNDQLAGFSNFGIGSVDIAAPGVAIFSTLTDGTGYADYWYMDGTSMATPHVSGALSILKAEFPTESYQRLIARLYSGADRIPSLVGKCTTGARLNLYRSLTENPTDMFVTPVDARRFGGAVGGPYSPSTGTYTVTNRGTTALDWTATAQTSWLTVSPTSGTLAPNASTVVSVTVNSNANTLAAGVHTGSVSFVNTSTGSGSGTRSVSLGLGNLHVKPAGNDANDGSSWALAKQTIQGALDAVHPGQEIWVTGGYYAEHPNLVTDTAIYGGFAGTETSLSQRPAFPRAYPDANETVVDGEWSEDYSQVFNVACGNNVSRARIDGFTVTRGVGYAGIMVYCSGPTVTNCILKQTYGGGGGVYCYGDSAAKITNNYFTENGWDVGGIGCRFSSPLIANNVFVGCGNTALMLMYESSPLIVNNTIVGVDHAAILASDCSPTVANNLLEGNRSGFAVYQYQDHPCNPIFYNNCVHSRDLNYDGVPDPTGTNGNISADPLLASLQYGNLHIQPGSPCRNAGSNGWALSTRDMDGQNRIQENRVDIGADETSGSSWTVTPIIVRVSPDGNDANDGSSWAQAMRTIQAGLDRASMYGGEVWAKAGSYAEAVYLPPFAYLYGGFAGNETSRDQRNWSANITLIDGTGGYEALRTIGGSHINWNGVDGVTLANSGAGAWIYNASTWISNCVVKNNLEAGIGGRYAMSSISNNVIMGNGGYGLGGFMRSMNVVGNTITKNANGVYCSGYSCPWIIANNIIAFNGDGLYAVTNPSNPSLAPTLTLSRNCVFGNTSYQYSQVTPDSGSISLDPKLAIVDYGNIHIQPTSPCKNAGNDSYVAAGTRDMDWQSRIQGTRVDIGADESDETTWSTIPRIIRVTSTGNDANDGSTWALAKRTIQGGITEAAKTGGEVWVKAGTYDERLTIGPFVSILGGFAGTETSKSQRNPTANVTIVDAQQLGSVVTIWPGYKCTTVDGFTLQHGMADCGGGVWTIAACPTISNNVIRYNTVDVMEPEYMGTGGGVFAAGGIVLSNNSITDNTALGPFYGGGGGGVCLRGGVQIVTGNTIARNSQVSDEGNSVGGGVFTTTAPWGISPLSRYSYMDIGADPYASTTITGNTIIDNTAQLAGGGIFCTSRRLNISGNTISGNAADGVDGAGGGLWFQQGDINYQGIGGTIVNNLIEDNQAAKYGAGIFCGGAGSERTFADNRILNNTTQAGGLGGGIYLSRSSPKLVNNTIAGNQASEGGALYLIGYSDLYSSPAVSNNIIVSNSSGIYKGAVSSPTLRNNDVWNNTAYNYSGLQPGTGDISLDPKFIGNGNYHLASASPCINVGWDAAPGIPSTDMDGQQRINGMADMGADEYLILRVATTGNDSNNGMDWQHPKRTIQAAVDAVSSCPADIWVAQGTYEGVITKDLVQLYGGFAGSETLRSQRDWKTRTTTMSSSAFGGIVQAYSGETRDTRIDGFTITGGASLQGGGVYCWNASPTIVNNKIANNDCAWPASFNGSGGGVYCGGYSNPLIENNAIKDNWALYGGGITSEEQANPTIANNVISGNAAIYDAYEAGSGGWGGGIYCLGAATIVNNTIVGNTRANQPDSRGGGIYCHSSLATIANNIVAFNTDGIAAANGVTPTLSHNDVYGNQSGNYTYGLQAGLTDISSDPLFVNRASGDLHIRTSSPCRNAGDSSAATLIAKDMDGQNRVEGASVDIGADESYGETYPTVQLRVKADSTNDGPGNDWGHAFHTIGQALSYATSGDEIWVAAGTYVEPVYPGSNVSVYGGFAGTETLRTQRNWNTNISIIDGNNSWAPVFIEYVENARVDGFTIRNGLAHDALNGGGGVYISGASGVVANNIITNNSAAYEWMSGAGIYCESSTAEITGNLIKSNTAGIGGGGIATIDSSATITNNVLALNSAPYGAGIRISGTGTVTIVNNTIADNTSTTGAGGIDCYSSSPTIKNNIVAYNSAGIGKSGTGSVPVLSYNDVFGNTSYQYGPGLTAGTGSISSNPFFADRASGDYHLPAGSPCTDAGTNTGAPTADKDGVTRPIDGDGNGSAVTDMGAYERPTDIAGAIRLCPNGSSVTLRSVVVTACFTGADPSGQNWVYVENTDRTAGIRVKTAQSPAVNSRVNLTGTVQTDTATGERYINAAAGDPQSAGGTTVIAPLGLRGEWIGGGASGLAPQLRDGFGFYNVGLLVNAWGRVPSTGTGCFFLHDGSNVTESSGATGVRVILPAGASMPQTQAFLRVTGVCGAMLVNGQYVRVIRPRTAADIQTITNWTTGSISLQENATNPLVLPGIPLNYQWPESIFAGCPPGAGIPLDGFLTRYDAVNQYWVTYTSSPPSNFGSCLVADGYGLAILPGGNTCFNFQRAPLTEDLLFSLPVGSTNGVNFSYLGNAFTAAVPWSNCKVTNGTWVRSLPDAVSQGLIHRVSYWNGSGWQNVTNLSTGSMAAGMPYQFFPRDNSIAVIVPKP